MTDDLRQYKWSPFWKIKLLSQESYRPEIISAKKHLLPLFGS